MKNFLLQEFEMRNLREFTYFFGIQVMRDHNKGTISLGQPKYIREILKSFDMDNCNPIITPLKANINLYKPITTKTP